MLCNMTTAWNFKPNKMIIVSTCIFFDHLLIHFELTRKKSTRKLTNYRDSEISELEIFCFSKCFVFFKILWKIWNFASKTKRIFFYRGSNYFDSWKKFLLFLYRIVDLPTSKFCRYLDNCYFKRTYQWWRRL